MSASHVCGITPSWWMTYAARLAERWRLLLGAVAAFLALPTALWAACTVIADDPLVYRRNDICALLRSEPDCVFDDAASTTLEIEFTETEFFVYRSGAFLGQFPILGGLPIDPDDLTEPVVARLLRYRTGGEEVQHALRQQLRRGPWFIDETLAWDGVAHRAVVVARLARRAGETP